MLQRLRVKDGQTEEQARRQFDALLGTSGWPTPGRAPREVEPRDPAAPWWWQGDEEASGSFLAAMGVTLDG